MTQDGGSSPARVTARSAVVVASVLVTCALYLGREVMVPIAIGAVLAAILAPVVAALRRARVPAPAGATVSVVGSLALLVALGAALEVPLRGLSATVPRSLATAQTKLQRVVDPLRRLSSTMSAPAPPPSAPAPSHATPASPAPSPSGSPATSPPPSPAAGSGGGGVKGPDLHASPVAAPGGDAAPRAAGPAAAGGIESAAGRVVGFTTSLIGDLVEVLLLALFVLAAGDGWARKLGRAIGSEARAARVLEAAGQMRAAVSRYLVVTALINAGQAVAVALALWALHFPSPALWGALTFLAEFIPYLGGMIMIGLLLVTGLATREGLLAGVLPAAFYLAVTSFQNNVVSPIAYGKGLRLNPTAILVAVIVWWALWGVAGAFLAVPILACLRILAAHWEPLAGLGVFLEE